MSTYVKLRDGKRALCGEFRYILEDPFVTEEGVYIRTMGGIGSLMEAPCAFYKIEEYDLRNIYLQYPLVQFANGTSIYLTGGDGLNLNVYYKYDGDHIFNIASMSSSRSDTYNYLAIGFMHINGDKDKHLPDGIAFYIVTGRDRYFEDGMGEFLLALNNVNYFNYSPILTGFVNNLEVSLLYVLDGENSIFEGGDENPLDQGGTSGPGGGTGNFDNDSDPIDIPNLPTLSASDTGLVKLYIPTLGEVRSLSNFLWSDLFSVDSFKKLFQNPMDAILGLSIIPCVPTIGGRKNCVIGNIDSGVEMNYASSQYVTVDCGTLNINEYWGSALDYSPYTLMQIYLPYIGSRTLNIDEVMNKALHLVYHIDISNGSCVALIKSGGSVLYQFNGNVSTVIPISGNDWSNTYRAMLSIVGSFAGGMIGAGVGMQTGGASGLTGSYALNAMGVNTTECTAPLVEGGLNAISSGAKAITHAKQIIDHSGNMAGSSGMLGIQTPYIIAIRPRQSMPQGYNQFVGFPCNMTLRLGDCRGFTTVEVVHLENIKATQSEIDEIESLLMGGVIL